MRVFLDTNVVLTGAFNPRGMAGALLNLRNATFLHSPQVLSECEHLISRDAPSREISSAASQQVGRFLAGLGSKCVPDRKPPSGISEYDPGDELILGAAIEANADVICTYNIKDFHGENLAVATPLTVCRDNLAPTVEQYIQRVMLSSAGTILFFGRIHHPSSMGKIISSENGTEVIADKQGFIRIRGEHVLRCSAMKPLPGDEEFRLAIRYKQSDFEDALWKRGREGWEKDVLSTGVANFSENTKPILFFVPNHRFSGHVQCISGLPRYVRDRNLLSSLENYSLEAIAGSLDLKWFLKHAVFSCTSITNQ